MDPNRSYYDTQFEILTNRLTNAEDQIRQLVNLTNTMRSEISSQQRVINTFNLINAERKLSNSKNVAQLAAQAAAAPANGSTAPPAAPQNPTLDTWDFNDTMDIDWDAFDGIDIANMAPVPAQEPKVTIQEPTVKPKVSALPISISTSVSSHKHSREESGDGDYPHEIKAMRYDSLDRILAYTVKASAVSDKNILKVDSSVNYDDERKLISGKIFRYMNVGDMNALSKLVSENFCDSLVMYFCQISETIYGKAEAMMLFSLLYESYPDGVWKQSNAEVHGKVVTTYYTFTGTSVFDMPLAVSFHQVKEHERGHKLSENTEGENPGHQIVRNVAEIAGTQQQQLNRGDSGQMSPTHFLNQGAFNLPNTALAPNSRSFTTGSTQQRRSLGAVEIDLTTFSIYDRALSPRSEHEMSTLHSASVPIPLQSTSTDASLPVNEHETADVIKIPRSKGNESFRLDVSRTGTIQNASTSNKSNGSGGANRPPSMNSELMANALIKKSESERRKCEITFNDYNLIVQMVITPCPK